MIKLYPMIKVSENKQGGFALIESIITLVIVAVVAATLFQYLGTSLYESSSPMQNLRQALELQQVMENITEDYIENVTDTTTLAILQGNIGPVAPPPSTTYSTSSPPTPYNVVENYFTSFASTSPSNFSESTPPSQDNLLKVTIKNNSGSLTTLFASFD